MERNGTLNPDNGVVKTYSNHIRRASAKSPVALNRKTD